MLTLSYYTVMSTRITDPVHSVAVYHWFALGVDTIERRSLARDPGNGSRPRCSTRRRSAAVHPSPDHHVLLGL